MGQGQCSKTRLLLIPGHVKKACGKVVKGRREGILKSRVKIVNLKEWCADQPEDIISFF